MEYYLPYLFWLGAICASIVVILLVLSITLGGDAEVDADVDSGGLGVVKSILIFVAVAAWTVRAVAINSPWTWIWAVAMGLLAGLIAVWLMSAALNFLWKQQEEGNWYMSETQDQKGYVYVPIPAGGSGRVILPIEGRDREVNAISATGEALPFLEDIEVVDYKEDHVVVRPLQALKPSQHEETV
jgi:membrane protein implicated in regulation of membrane protease activity